MNIVFDKWLLVQNADGIVEKIAPCELPGSSFVRTAHPRADYRALATELLCCIFQTACAPKTEKERLELLSQARLPTRAKLAAVREAFELSNEGPRFFQSPFKADIPVTSASSLFYESPGENTVGLNKSLFVAPDSQKTVCEHCAPLSLFMNQSHGRMGGSGYLTGPRKTSAMAVLVEGSTLWQTVCLNMLTTSWFDGQTAEPDDDPLASFPWLKPAEMFEGKNLYPLSAFGRFGVLWWSPVSLRLNFSENKQQIPCGACGVVFPLHVASLTRAGVPVRLAGPIRHPHTGWNPAGDKGMGRAVEIPTDGFTAEHWQALTIGVKTQESLPAWAQLSWRQAETARLHVFGFAMNQMSPMFWMDEITPVLTARTPEHRESLLSASHLLVGAVKDAYKALGYSLFRNPKKAINNPSFTLITTPAQACQQLWAELNPNIYEILRTVPDEGFDVETRDGFLKQVRMTALKIFDATTQDDGSNFEVTSSLLARKNNLAKRLQHKNAK